MTERRKNRNVTNIAVGGAVLGALILGGMVVKGAAPGDRAAMPRVLSAGMKPPDFTLPSADNRTLHLANYQGRTVFLAFVPSWDDAKTVAQARSLAASVPHFDAAGAKVLLVSSDSPEKAKALQEREELPFPLLLDTDNALAKQCGVPSGNYRTTFVIEPSGKVKYRVGDTIVMPEKHGPQLLDISKCCIDEVMAARAHGIGKAIGPFSLPRVDRTGGLEPLFGSESAGARIPTVVLFLSVKCPCSNSYNERIAGLAKRFAGKPVRIVGVYPNTDETATEIAAHARRNGFTFPIFRDERALGADHFGASITPEAFLVDGEQTLRYAGRIDDSRDAEAVKRNNLAEAVEALLQGQPLQTGDTAAFGCGIVRTAITAD
jgi:peroxiredoxin